MGFPWQLFPLPICVKGSTPLKLSARFLFLPLLNSFLQAPSVYFFPPRLSSQRLQVRRVGKHSVDAKYGACWKWNFNLQQTHKIKLGKEKASLPSLTFVEMSYVDGQYPVSHHSSLLHAWRWALKGRWRGLCVCV